MNFAKKEIEYSRVLAKEAEDDTNIIDIDNDSIVHRVPNPISQVYFIPHSIKKIRHRSSKHIVVNDYPNSFLRNVAGDEVSFSIRDSDVFIPGNFQRTKPIKSRPSSRCICPRRTLSHKVKPTVSPDITNLLNIINESTNSNDWVRVVNQKNTVFYKKQIPDCPVVLVKGSTILEGIPIGIMWRAIADLDLRRTWDTVFSTMEVVESYPDGTELVYFVLKGPFGIQGRDFLQKRTIMHDYPRKSQTIIHFVSVENDVRPPIKKYIRAHTYISGYYFKEISKSPLRCQIDIVAQTDIKGAIPKTIVNMFAGSKSKAWTEGYKKGCLKLMNDMKAKGIPLS